MKNAELQPQPQQPAELERRYLVLKQTDMAAALSPQDHEALGRIMQKVEAHRLERGAGPLQCAVVEADWPEYPDVVDSILERSRPGPRYVTPEIAQRAKEVLLRSSRQRS